MKLNITQEQYIQLRQQGKSPEQIATEYAARDIKQSINSFADKVVDFIPGLRTATNNFASEIARSQTRDPVARANIENSAPTMKETVGSAIQLGANFIPVGKLAQGLTTGAAALGAGKAASSIGAISSGALAGYAFDIGNNLETGQAPGKPGIGTAVGTAIPAVGVTANALIKSLAAKTPENRFLALTKDYATVKRAFDKGSVYKTVNGTKTLARDPISTLIREKAVPAVQNAKIDTTLSDQQLLDKIEAFGKLNQKAIDDATAQGVTVPLVSVKQAILENVKKNTDLRAAGAVGKTLGKVQTILDDFEMSYGQRLPINAVDEIRTAMNRVWNPDEVDAARAIGDAMRRFQYDSVPGSRAILLKEGELMAARDFLRTLHGKTVSGGRLGRYFGDVIGAIAGSTTQLPVVGPVAGAMGARAIANRIASSYFSPIGSRGARTLQNMIDGTNIQSPGDAFLNTKTGAAVQNYVNDAQVGMSIKDVSQMSNAPQMKLPTNATTDAANAIPNAQTMISNIDTTLPQKGAVSSPGTKSSRPSTDTNTSTSNALTGRGDVSVQKTNTSGGFAKSKDYSHVAELYQNGEDFYIRMPVEVRDGLRAQGIKGQDAVTSYWEKATGKTAKTGYQMSHRPTEGPRAFNLTEKVDGEQMIPEDMYQEWYGSRGTKEDMESIAALKSVRGNPDANVTIYRASPSPDFNHGDWVTLSKSYAEQHAAGNNVQVSSKVVKASEIKWAGDDINEFGYFPSKPSPSIPKELAPLAEEARKYKTAEEFVKAQGTPLYHGTKHSFDVFEDKYLGQVTGSKSAKEGFYFTTNRDVAEGYANFGDSAKADTLKKEADRLEEIAKRTNKGSDWDAYNEAYLKYEDEALAPSDYSDRRVIEARLNIKNPLVVDFENKRFIDEDYMKLLETAKKNGHDGVIIKNVSDAVETTYSLEYEPDSRLIGDIYVPFSAQQIKTRTQLIDLWKKANGKE